uniref:Uncharacterized protein n=1 Tax=Aotus nancymaae TaxID=37293 RepID=A0A2K5CTW4_AOTNA
IESSCWDKDPPGERSPQHGQHWRARDHGASGCGPHQVTATASTCPRPGLWTTPAHSSCMPQTNTRRAQADNNSVYIQIVFCNLQLESWVIHHGTQMSSVLPWSPLVRGPWHNKNSPQDSWATWVCPHRTLRLHSSGFALSASLPVSGLRPQPRFLQNPCHPSWSHHTQPMSIGGLRGCLHLPRSGTTTPPKYLQTLSSPASHQ